MNLKNKMPLLYLQAYQKRKEVPYIEIYMECTYMGCHDTMTQRDAYISNRLQLQNQSLPFIRKIKSLLLVTSILSQSPMAYNTTAFLDKLTCTDYVEFGKCQTDLDDFLGPKMIPITWM